MSDVGQRGTPGTGPGRPAVRRQARIRYLGNRQYRPGNANIEPENLRARLRKQGTSETLIDRA